MLQGMRTLQEDGGTAGGWGPQRSVGGQGQWRRMGTLQEHGDVAGGLGTVEAGDIVEGRGPEENRGTARG